MAPATRRRHASMTAGAAASTMPWVYIAFVALVIGLLALDLGVLNRRPHVIRVAEALGWSALWIGLGLLFSLAVYAGYEHRWFGLGTGVDALSTPWPGPGGVPIYNDGASALEKYLTGFVVEKSLAVDNIFVIAIIFSSLAVPPIYQHRVLVWGVVGALLMRGLMIAVGAALVTRFSWILYVFGAFLLLTGIKMLAVKRNDIAPVAPTDRALVRWIRRLVPITERYHGQHFLVRAGGAASREPLAPGAAAEPDRVVDRARAGALLATPLLLAVVMVELSDAIFAVDSIPAIFAITTDPFLVFTSNVFAILGLRSLYFALSGIIDRFRYLKVALSFVLILIGGKMLAHHWLEPLLGDHVSLVTLAAVAAILAAGVLASLTRPLSKEPA
jgi:tellurite resistance protein TerC